MSELPFIILCKTAARIHAPNLIRMDYVGFTYNYYVLLTVYLHDF